MRSGSTETAVAIPATPNAGQKLRAWYASLLGQSTMTQIRPVLDDLLHATYGYHAVQIGVFDHGDVSLQNSDLIHPVLMDVGRYDTRVAMTGDPAALPFRARSLDLVVLMHTLELSSDPYQVLREVDRVLAEDGYLLIVGFNSRSLWGAMRWLLGWRGKAPWHARFYSIARVRDWLRVLGFRSLRRESVFFAPPIGRAGVLRHLRFLELLRHVLPYRGGIYLIKARKSIVPLTPIRLSWSSRRRLVTGGFARPTSGVGSVHMDREQGD